MGLPHTRAIPWVPCFLASGHSPLSIVLPSRLQGCLDLPFLFSRARLIIEWLAFLSRALGQERAPFHHSTLPRYVIHATYHPQRGAFPGSIEVSPCSQPMCAPTVGLFPLCCHTPPLPVTPMTPGAPWGQGESVLSSMHSWLPGDSQKCLFKEKPGEPG